MPHGKVAAPGVRTADWVIANETGWGLPHAGVVILAGIVVGARVVGWLIGQVAEAAERAPRWRRPRS